MKIRLLSLGKTADSRYRSLADDYAARLGRFTPLERVEIREGKEKDLDKRLKGEAERVFARLPSGGVVIVSDESGRDLSSQDLSSLIASKQLAGAKAFSVVIGSAYGLDPSLKAGAGMAVRLSAMTLPHEMAHVLWLEQLYRAFCILANKPYHH